MSSQSNPERHVRYRWAAEVVTGGRVLDAACGSGWGTALLARGAAETVGADISSPAIASAREQHGAEIEFREGDLRKLPFGNEEFDWVVCFEAIVEPADPARVLDELRRVLRPSGTLLVSAPNRRVYPSGNPLHRSSLDSAELEELLRERFASVAMYRQQGYHASLLGSTAALAHDDPATALEAGVLKSVAGAPGSELHAVAAAGNGELPSAPAWVALGELVDYAEQQAQLEHWQERAVKAEATALAQARELRELRG